MNINKLKDKVFYVAYNPRHDNLFIIIKKTKGYIFPFMDGTLGWTTEANMPIDASARYWNESIVLCKL